MREQSGGMCTQVEEEGRGGRAWGSPEVRPGLHSGPEGSFSVSTGYGFGGFSVVR